MSGNIVTYHCITRLLFRIQVMQTMNKTTKYEILAFAAVSALVFTLLPYVMADEGTPAMWGDGAKHPMGHNGHMGDRAITVDGFVGSIQIPETVDNTTHDTLKSQVTVSLSQAVSIAENNGFVDAMRANMGIVKDSDGNKYLAWTVSSITKDATTNAVTENIFVVDAGNEANFASTTKTFDHSKWSEKMSGDNTARFEQFKQKFSEPTGNADVDAARAQFLDLKQQLHDAIKNGDTATAQDIKKQLQELRPSLFLKTPEL